MFRQLSGYVYLQPKAHHSYDRSDSHDRIFFGCSKFWFTAAGTSSRNTPVLVKKQDIIKMKKRASYCMRVNRENSDLGGVSG